MNKTQGPGDDQCVGLTVTEQNLEDLATPELVDWAVKLLLSNRQGRETIEPLRRFLEETLTPQVLATKNQHAVLFLLNASYGPLPDYVRRALGEARRVARIRNRRRIS